MTSLALPSPLLPVLFLALTAIAACAGDWIARGKIAHATTYATTDHQPATVEVDCRREPRVRLVHPYLTRLPVRTDDPPSGLVWHRPSHQRLGTRPHTPEPPGSTLGLVPVQCRPQLPQRPRHRLHHSHAPRKLDMVRPSRRPRSLRLRHPLQPRRLQSRHRPSLHHGPPISRWARNPQKPLGVIARFVSGSTPTNSGSEILNVHFHANLASTAGRQPPETGPFLFHRAVSAIAIPTTRLCPMLLKHGREKQDSWNAYAAERRFRVPGRCPGKTPCRRCGSEAWLWRRRPAGSETRANEAWSARPTSWGSVRAGWSSSRAADTTASARATSISFWT